MTTALNVCRRQMRQPKLLRIAHEPVSDTSSQSSLRVDLIDGLRKLSFRQRQAMILYYIGDFSVRQVAEWMNISEGSVKAHLSKARRTLRNQLQVKDDAFVKEILDGP